MSLSPWPSQTAVAALAMATSTLKDAIDPGAADATIQRLGATASAIIEQYAGTAPQAVKDEATIRLSGYMHETGKGADFGAARSKSIDLDSIKISTERNMAAGALRRSGAMSLLSFWHNRQGASA